MFIKIEDASDIIIILFFDILQVKIIFRLLIYFLNQFIFFKSGQFVPT